MRSLTLLFTLAAVGLSSVACSPALAQVKVAGPVVSESQTPSIGAVQAPTRGDPTPLTAETKALGTPTVDLAKYVVPKSGPTIVCPAGARESRSETAGGWEVACLRGAERHGPYRSFDRKTWTEIQAVYDGGKLHGRHVEIRLAPAIVGGDASLVPDAQKALDAGWPLVAPPEPTCPSGTTVLRADYQVACVLIDGTLHGPRMLPTNGRVTWQSMTLGVDRGGAVLDDRRKARESVYERGTLKHVLEHETGKLLFLEVHSGDDTLLLKWMDTSTTSVARLRKGKLHGAQTTWNTDGSLRSLRTYRDGEEHGSGADWDSAGPRLVRHVTSGKGVEETYPSSNEARRCQFEAGQTLLCETVTKDKVTGDKVTAREVYEGGRLRARVALALDGVKREEETRSASGDVPELRYWGPDGKLTFHRSCDDKQCTSVYTDQAGKVTTRVDPQSSPAVPEQKPDPLTGPLNEVRQLLGGAGPKPTAKVAVP